MLSVCLLLLREGRSLLLTGGNLAGLVQDDKEDEDEDADHRVADDGHDGPHRQAHPQLMFHGFRRSIRSLRTRQVSLTAAQQLRPEIKTTNEKHVNKNKRHASLTRTRAHGDMSLVNPVSCGQVSPQRLLSL